MPHQHLSLQSLHGLQRDADDDDDGGTADGQILHIGQQDTCDHGQQSYDTQIDRAEDNDLADDLLDEVRGRLAGTEAGDEAAVLLHVVGDLHGVILDGRVEPAEEEDQQEVDDNVDPAGGAEHVLVPPTLGPAAESADGSGHGSDGRSKDDGHNAGHRNLNRQVGVLATVDLTAHNALGILNGDPALGIIDSNDQEDQSSHTDNDQDDLPPHHVEQSVHHGGHAGDDTDKQDQGDTVATMPCFFCAIYLPPF